MTDNDATEFIISRLAELVVAVFNDHVGSHVEATKARVDARLALAALGDGAERNGRADLMPLLRGLAIKIRDVDIPHEREPRFYDPANTARKTKHRWYWGT